MIYPFGLGDGKKTVMVCEHWGIFASAADGTTHTRKTQTTTTELVEIPREFCLPSYSNLGIVNEELSVPPPSFRVRGRYPLCQGISVPGLHSPSDILPFQVQSDPLLNGCCSDQKGPECSFHHSFDLCIPIRSSCVLQAERPREVSLLLCCSSG